MGSEYNDRSLSKAVEANHSGDTEQDEDEDMEEERLHTRDTYYHGTSITSQGVACLPQPKCPARTPGKPRTAYRRGDWGSKPLTMTENYAKRSGWSSRAGVRELVQNMYPPPKFF
jgi:hypothetical protein